MNTLFIVSTPIGNLQDITIRAIKTLFAVDYILTENVLKMKLLLSELKKRYPDLITEEKKAKVLQFNEYIENEKIYEFLELFERNYDIALTSEAGTPLISDPGFKLVRYAIEKEVNVISIPGPSAVITSLTSSGLPTDKFLFLGFLPKTSSKKEKLLKSLKEDLKNINPTIVFYESPHRLIETLNLLKQVYGDIKIIITRELTKKFEEINRDNISTLLDNYRKQAPKGEFVILLNINN